MNGYTVCNARSLFLNGEQYLTHRTLSSPGQMLIFYQSDAVCRQRFKGVCKRMAILSGAAAEIQRFAACFCLLWLEMEVCRMAVGTPERPLHSDSLIAGSHPEFWLMKSTDPRQKINTWVCLQRAACIITYTFLSL